MLPPSPHCTQTDTSVDSLITTADPLPKNNINFAIHLEVNILSQPNLKNNFPTGGQVRKLPSARPFQQKAVAKVCQLNHAHKPTALKPVCGTKQNIPRRTQIHSITSDPRGSTQGVSRAFISEWKQQNPYLHTWSWW